MFTGKVWPGITVFPDFFNPATHEYWTKEVWMKHVVITIGSLHLANPKSHNYNSLQCITTFSNKSNDIPMAQNFDRRKY